MADHLEAFFLIIIERISKGTLAFAGGIVEDHVEFATIEFTLPGFRIH